MLARRDKAEVVALHQNAQRLIEPLAVVNPFAKSLRFPSRSTRSRRDHTKYLSLIDAIALLHQHQRTIHEAEHRGDRFRYIEVTEADIALADKLAAEVIGSRSEDLPPQTVRLLDLIRRFVKAKATEQGIDPIDVRFTRRQLLSTTHFGYTQLSHHLTRLVELEHVVVHAGGGKRRMVYGLAEPGLTGLDATFSGSSRPDLGGPPREETPCCSAEVGELHGRRAAALLASSDGHATWPADDVPGGR